MHVSTTKPRSPSYFLFTAVWAWTFCRASACRAEGRLERAEELVRPALGMLELALGRRHPEVANALGELASLRMDRGGGANEVCHRR